MVATDNGSPEPFSTSAEVVVMLFPSNNNFNPVLNQRSYDVSLDENSPSGSVVLTFNITDADRSGPAAELGRAIILNDDAQFFNVTITSTTTGEITSKYVSSIIA